MKLVTLGHGRVGKTTLLNKLRSILNPAEIVEVISFLICFLFFYDILNLLINFTKDLNTTKSTIGVDRKTFSLAEGEVSVWDFAGQLEYTNTHQLFLSTEVYHWYSYSIDVLIANTLLIFLKMVIYLLCFDLSKPLDEQCIQLEYWLDYLNSALPLPQSESMYSDTRKWVILLVGLKSDLQINPESALQSHHLTAWSNRFPHLPLFPRLFSVSSIKLDQNVMQLLAIIENECNHLFSKHTALIPSSYRDILRDIKAHPHQYGVRQDLLFKLYAHGLKKEGFAVALQYLHTIGQIVALKKKFAHFPRSLNSNANCSQVRVPRRGAIEFVGCRCAHLK
jgi:GTPase SAR1 family protein